MGSRERSDCILTVNAELMAEKRPACGIVVKNILRTDLDSQK